MDMKLRPNLEEKVQRTTRFGATPTNRDTWGNHRMPPKTAGFISDSERFKKSYSSVGIKCEFQQEDKNRKNMYTAGRLNRRAERIRNIESKAAQADMNIDQFDQ